MNRSAEPPPPVPAWPITVEARWSDPGYSRLDVHLGAGFAAAWLWMETVPIVLGERVEPRLFVIPLVIAVWFGWVWLRRRPSDAEAVLEPGRLRIRDGAGTAWVDVPRSAAGMLLAAERGLDWRERVLALVNASDRVVLRVRAGLCTVRFLDVADASDAWWRSTMPAGSSPQQPPTAVSVTSLIGAWWPIADDRRSVRGNLGVRSRWKEPDLVHHAAWDRRQRLQYGLVAIATLLFVYGFAAVATWPWSLAQILSVVPPGAIALAVAVRGLLR